MNAFQGAVGGPNDRLCRLFAQNLTAWTITYLDRVGLGVNQCLLVGRDFDGFWRTRAHNANVLRKEDVLEIHLDHSLVECDL
jgi:hypothetical protein